MAKQLVSQVGMDMNITEVKGKQEPWRQQLAEFARANQQELAALDWGLRQERQNQEEILGIDMEPVPRFVCCSQEAIEQLNRQVNSLLQEVVGVVQNKNPEKEVTIIGIGPGQIKLIQFTPEPPPPVCFEQVGADVDTLLDRLEQRLREYVERG